jgi:hypothetical protein
MWLRSLLIWLIMLMIQINFRWGSKNKFISSLTFLSSDKVLFLENTNKIKIRSKNFNLLIKETHSKIFNNFIWTMKNFFEKINKIKNSKILRTKMNKMIKMIKKKETLWFWINFYKNKVKISRFAANAIKNWKKILKNT